MENTVKSDRVEGREKEIIKMRAKKLLAVGLSVLCVASLVTGCGSKKGDKAAGGSKPISVVTREDGSGTRGAFIELFGIEQEEGGKKVDKTTASASVSQSTEVMMTTVAGDEYAIGYTSLGALNDKVKALKVDGVEATAENVKSGTYKISRPFNIATKKDVSEAAQDFINYIMSADGQKVVEDNGYIAVSENAAFKSNGAKGKIVVAGSSSVTPVMEKLAEAYQKVNTGAQVEVQQSDSTTGMTSAAEGTCDIGTDSFRKPPSMPISPNSFSIRTTFWPAKDSLMSFLIRVVLPAPRKPEKISIFVIMLYASFFFQKPARAVQQSEPQSAGSKILHSYYNKAVNGKPPFLMRKL